MVWEKKNLEDIGTYENLKEQLKTRIKSKNRSPENMKKIRFIQQLISRGCFLDNERLSYRDPYRDWNAFSKREIKRIYKLLQRTANYLKGSGYEGRSSRRPEKFRKMLEYIHQGNKEMSLNLRFSDSHYEEIHSHKGLWIAVVKEKIITAKSSDELNDIIKKKRANFHWCGYILKDDESWAFSLC